MRMLRIPFKVERSIIMASADAAYFAPGRHDACEALCEAVMQNISTDVEITAGGVTLHLAAWQDPDHWSSDWAKQGIDDPHAFIFGLVSNEGEDA